MAAERSMHQMTDSVWGAALSSQEPRCCQDTVSIQLSHRMPTAGPDTNMLLHRDHRRRRRKSLKHRQKAISSLQHYRMIWEDSWNICMQFGFSLILKIFIKKTNFQKIFFKCLWKTLWIAGLPLYKCFTNQNIKVETNGVSSLQKNWNLCVALFLIKLNIWG